MLLPAELQHLTERERLIVVRLRLLMEKRAWVQAVRSEYCHLSRAVELDAASGWAIQHYAEGQTAQLAHALELNRDIRIQLCAEARRIGRSDLAKQYEARA